MTFDDLLAQVLALLQREQRLSYRALQRRFALEEADLEALKDELIYAKRLADDGGGARATVAHAPTGRSLWENGADRGRTRDTGRGASRRGGNRRSSR